MISQMDIKVGRTKLRMSQRDLAGRAGISLTTVQRMESDQHGPNAAIMENVKKIMEALDL